MHLQQSNKKNNERANFEKKIKLFGLVEIAFNRIPHSYLHCWFFFFFSSSSLSSSSFFFIMPLLFFSLLSLYLSLVSFASSVIQPSASSVSLWSSICGARKLNMRKKIALFLFFWNYLRNAGAQSPYRANRFKWILHQFTAAKAKMCRQNGPSVVVRTI